MATPTLTVPVSTENWLRQRYPSADLRAIIRLIATEKRTGALTIHFTQGAVGTLEWKQRTGKCPVAQGSR